MIVKLNSYVIRGLQSENITVESSVAPGLAKFEIIGLADTAIKESKERIFKSLLENGFQIPPGNITINLAPAKIKKRGPLYDLPIILGILLASRQITTIHDLDKFVIAGELSLDGKVREVEGVFTTTLQHQEDKFSPVYLVPQDNLRDFSFFPELNDRVFLVRDLKDAVEQLKQLSPLTSIKGMLEKERKKKFSEHSLNLYGVRKRSNLSRRRYDGDGIGYQENSEWDFDVGCREGEMNDFKEVMGHDLPKLAVQLSVISRLNLLLVGPPGGGKSMLVRRIPSILPQLTKEESLMVTRIHHACSRINQQKKSMGLIEKPPFREVHNSIHTVSLIGGGKFPEPGEISLAHKGFLFLDELSECRKDSLQSLRIPMEKKSVSLSRLEANVEYPCDFTLIACTNPCACGYYGDAVKMCRCSREMMHRFYQRLSGPILDRFDLILFVNQFDRKNMQDKTLGSQEMKKNIDTALERKKKIANPFYRKTMKEIFQSHPMIEKILMDSLEKNLISFRKIKSILKTCYALQLYYGQEMDEALLFQAIEFCRNKFSFTVAD